MKCVTARLHVALSAWMVLCTSGALAIKVKFGTNDGPIVPPTPEPKVVPVPPFREPAPVWEQHPDDLPDPNATWRPLFVPNPLYTHVSFQPSAPVAAAPVAAPAAAPVAAPAQTSAQRFVSAYLPRPAPSPAPQQYSRPAQQAAVPHQQTHQVSQLSSQSVPGVGLRYFVPSYERELQQRKENSHKYEDSRQNHIDNNEVDDHNRASSHDANLVYEKDATRRARNSLEGSHSNVVYYQWPVYNPFRHH